MRFPGCCNSTEQDPAGGRGVELWNTHLHTQENLYQSDQITFGSQVHKSRMGVLHNHWRCNEVKSLLLGKALFHQPHFRRWLKVREKEKWRTVGCQSRRRKRKALREEVWFICCDLSAAAFSRHLNFRTDMSRSLCHLNGSIQWLSATPQLPSLQIVPGKGKTLTFRPDHLLAFSPLLRDLLPAGWIFSFPLIHHVQQISNLRFPLVFTIYLHAGCLRGRS